MRICGLGAGRAVELVAAIVVGLGGQAGADVVADAVGPAAGWTAWQ